MQAEAIITHPAPNGQPPTHPHVPIPPAIPYAADQAEVAALHLATFREFCSQAGQALVVFGLSLGKVRSQEEFQVIYDMLIVAHGLHTWLTPAAAGRLWAAVEVGEWQP